MTPALYETCKRLLQNKNVKPDEAVTLSCTNDVARKISKQQLDRLAMPDYAYFAVDRHGRTAYVNSTADEDRAGSAQGPMLTDENSQRRPVFGSMSEPAVLHLRVGAKVLSTAKLHDRVQTGTLGKVASFDDGLVDVMESHELVYHVDAEQVQDDMIHVAPDGMWPQVEFKGTDGNPVLVTVRAKQVDVQDNMGTMLCSRTQVPLVLAYSITVHRSQGLTLPAVIMHVGKLFAYGQLYTGLSRVGNFDKLRVSGALSFSMKLCEEGVRRVELDTVWTIIANGPADPGVTQASESAE
ncbi:TPA: DNA helicase [Trebouxia sp. C0005]